MSSLISSISQNPQRAHPEELITALTLEGPRSPKPLSKPSVLFLFKQFLESLSSAQPSGTELQVQHVGASPKGQRQSGHRSDGGYYTEH